MLAAALAALWIAQAAPPPQEPPAAGDEDIVVIARRMESWRGTIRVRDGRPVCRITRSSGDPEVDAIGCGETVRCMSEILIPAQEAARQLRRPPRAERRAMVADVNRRLSACLEAGYTREREALSARRIAARQARAAAAATAP